MLSLYKIKKREREKKLFNNVNHNDTEVSYVVITAITTYIR